MQSVDSASALLGLDAVPLVLLDLHSQSWKDWIGYSGSFQKKDFKIDLR